MPNPLYDALFRPHESSGKLFLVLKDGREMSYSGFLGVVARIAHALVDAGVKPGDRVVTYCHIGQQASLLYLASRYAGHQASLYDGSFEDWSGRSELPLVGPVKK